MFHLGAFKATPAERRAAYPGEELIRGGARGSAMAVTIAAPPREVWPWLMQMGCGRAGFYSWDRLDNGGRPSADRIHPEWQDLCTGGRMFCVPDQRAWFDVVVLEVERVLVLRASMRVPRMECFDPAVGTPRCSVDSTWAFLLSDAPDDGTRLVIRTDGRGRPSRLFDLFNLLVGGPAHRVMQAKQLGELRRLTERIGASP
jgi:hypothetical protein